MLKGTRGCESPRPLHVPMKSIAKLSSYLDSLVSWSQIVVLSWAIFHLYLASTHEININTYEREFSNLKWK